MPSNILLIEDDATLRAELLDYFTRRRHRVTACATLADATEFIERSDSLLAPDAVLSDINLPDGDGVSFYVANAPRIPKARWVLMSGDRDLVLLGLRTKDVANLPNCAVVEKPVPLRLLDRLLQSTATPLFANAPVKIAGRTVPAATQSH